MRFQLVMCTIFWLCLACTTSLGQGALDGYMKGKGKLDVAVSFSFMNAKQFEGAGGAIFNEPFKGNLLSVFAEYGITKDMDVVATIPYIFTSTNSGLQDGGLYLKYRAVHREMKKNSRFSMLAAGGVSAPLGGYSPLATGAIGQRAVVLQPRVILQYESMFGVFFNVTGGYNIRLDKYDEEQLSTIRLTRPDYNPAPPSDYGTALFKIGFPAAKYYLDAWVERQFTKGGEDYRENVVDLPQAYGVSYTQIGGTAYYSESGKRGVYVGAGYILNGRNVSKVFRFTLGAVLKW